MSDSKGLFEEANIYCRHLFHTEQEQAFEIVSRLKDFALKLEARNKELESAVSDLLETLCDELGLSYVMSNIESIDKACSILSSEHKFSKGGNQ